MLPAPQEVIVFFYRIKNSAVMILPNHAETTVNSVKKTSRDGCNYATNLLK